MLTSETIKRFATEMLSVDKIGVANIERFQGAPLELHPASIMPRVKSVIVFIRRIPRGCFRGIDEGTHWPSYTVFGYAGLTRMMTSAGYKLARFIESFGYEGVALLPSASNREIGPRGPRPGKNKPKREATVHHRLAAVAAGLGELGWSKVLLTEEFGPRQRIGVVLTDAKLEPDPLVNHRICDRCKRCVAECPAGAISKDEGVKVEIEGQVFEHARLDVGKCKLTHFGLNRTVSPHFCKKYPGVFMPIEQQEPTWKEALDLGFAVMKDIPNFEALRRLDDFIAVCGARGCILGCVKHLEKRDKIKATFANKVFSDKEPWRIEAKPPHVDHHGFIYDPAEDSEMNERQGDAPTWY